MSTIYVYISGCGDQLKELLDRASLADNPDEIRRLSQDIEAANEVWKKWCLAMGGDVISAAGNEFKFRVGADHLVDVPELRSQYEQLTGASTSVGVGTKLSEADKALAAAKKSGGDMVRLYGPDVDEELAEDEESSGFLAKADVEPAPPSKGGPVPAEQEQAPETAETPIQPDQTPPHDVHEVLGNVASAQGKVDESQTQQGAEQDNAGNGQKDLKGQVLQVLSVIKQKAPELEGLQQQDPELYQGITGLIQSMIAMARKAFGGEEQEVKKSELLPGGKGDGKPDSDFDDETLEHGVKTEMEEHGLDRERALEIAKDHLTEDPNYYAMDKAALQAGKTGHHQVKYPVGSQKDPGANGTHDAGKIKIQTGEGKVKWRSVRANMISAADGSATSSRNPGAK
jgi:hypothetical protein